MVKLTFWKWGVFIGQTISPMVGNINEPSDVSTSSGLLQEKGAKYALSC